MSKFFLHGVKQMNEKYIQALIVGGLIGAAIIIAEFISQSNDDPMKFHAIKLHEDSQVKMADKKIWITDNGETIDLSPDNKEEKRIVIKMNTDDSDNLSMNEEISIFKTGQTDHKEKKVVVKVDARNKDKDNDIDIDVDAIVEEVLAGLEEGAEVLQDSDIGKIVAKALNGIDAEVKIEVSVDTNESSPDSP